MPAPPPMSQTLTNMTTLWPNDWASRVSSVCGVISLVLTAILTTGAINVTRRAKKILFFPKFTTRLTSRCEKVLVLLGDYSAKSNDISVEVHMLLGDLKSLRTLTEKQLRITADATIDEVAIFVNTPSEVSARNGVYKTYQLLTEVENSHDALWFS